MLQYIMLVYSVLDLHVVIIYTALFVILQYYCYIVVTLLTLIILCTVYFNHTTDTLNIKHLVEVLFDTQYVIWP